MKVNVQNTKAIGILIAAYADCLVVQREKKRGKGLYPHSLACHLEKFAQSFYRLSFTA